MSEAKFIDGVLRIYAEDYSSTIEHVSRIYWEAYKHFGNYEESLRSLKIQLDAENDIRDEAPSHRA
jgi:hypothetical protein